MAQETRVAKKPRVTTMGSKDWDEEPDVSEGEDSDAEGFTGKGGAAFPMAGVLEFEGDDEDPISARQKKLNKKKTKSGGFESLGLRWVSKPDKLFAFLMSVYHHLSFQLHWWAPRGKAPAPLAKSARHFENIDGK
jgi:hypothetical protein